MEDRTLLTEKSVSRSEDGEFELILGNRQLLSVFFIVVVLLGVFFTMGYIVGKNAVTGTELAARKTEPIVVDPSKPSSFGTEPKTNVKPGDLGDTSTATPPPTVTPAEPPKTKSREEEAREARKAEAERKDAERKAEIERKAEAKRRAEDERKAEAERRDAERKADAERRAEAKKAAEAKKTETRKDAPRETPTRAAAAPTPQSGQQFLQVVASSKPDCEIIADVLRRKGFAAAVVPGPNDKVFRVVVGPLNDPGTISKTRSDLEAAGFQKPILRKF